MPKRVALLVAVPLAGFALVAGATADPRHPGPEVGAGSDSIDRSVSSFSALPSGDELIVRYDSHGCFHVLVCDLTFRRDAALSASVVLVRLSPGGVRDPRLLATVGVDDSTAADLDELMRLYRAGPGRRSNGGLRLDLRQIRNGAVIAHETIADTPTIVRFGSYGFDALIHQAWEAAPPAALSGFYR